MTRTPSRGEWVTRMAAREDNGIVSVGGLVARVAALERGHRSAALMALGKLIELRRREKRLTVESLTEMAHVAEADLIDLERGLRVPNTRDVICLLARSLELPEGRLLAVAGLDGPPDEELTSAALSFASRARPVEWLSQSEQAALSDFLKVIAAA